jgi:hypothetical protein
MESEESRLKRLLPVGASLGVVAILFGYQFLFQGGKEHLGPDSTIYLAAARGEVVIRPFHSRVLAPFAASVVAKVTGLSLETAFHFLTITSLLVSLLMLGILLARAGAPSRYQAGIILAFGSGMAIVFGHTPILVDPEILILTCLTLLALDRGLLGLALVGVCLAALTKDYGVALVLPWATEAFRKGRWRLLVGALAPVIVVVMTTMRPALPNPYYSYAAKYQVSLLRDLGPLVYVKTVYTWLWVAMWPVLVGSSLDLLVNIRRLSCLSRAQVWYGAMLVSVPVLLVSDWDRTFMLLVPFACLAGAGSETATGISRCVLVAVGGLATALARPYYTENTPPRALMLGLIVISAVASVLIVLDLAIVYVRRPSVARLPATAQTDPG